MKKISFLLLLLLLGKISVINAQTLTADEIIQGSNCGTIKCFDEIMTAKGFTQTTAAGTSYFYISNKYVKDVPHGTSSKNVCSIIFLTTQNYLTLTTTTKSYYLNLLDAFKAKGFLITSSEQVPNTNDTITKYESKDLPKLSLKISIVRKKEEYYKYPTYQVSITNSNY